MRKTDFDLLYERIMDDELDGKKPYQMNAVEFDEWLAGKRPIEVTGEWIREKTGISDVKELLEYYKKKYADRLKGENVILDLIDDDQASFSSKERLTGSKAAGLTRKEDDGYHIVIPTRGESADEIIGVFRHELEHVFDLIEGYETDKPSVEPGTLKVGEEGLEGKEKFKGHHHRYDWFDTDYLRRSMVRDAMEHGLPVPEEIRMEMSL